MNNPQIDESLLRAMAQAQSGGANVYTPPTMLVDLPSRGLLYPEQHPLYNKDSVEIISGVNLPMLIKAATIDNCDSFKEAVKRANGKIQKHNY